MTIFMTLDEVYELYTQRPGWYQKLFTFGEFCDQLKQTALVRIA